MADAFARYETLRKAAASDAAPTTTDLAILAGADAIVDSFRDLNRQLIASTEALVESIWDFLDFDQDDEEMDEDWEDEDVDPA